MRKHGSENKKKLSKSQIKLHISALLFQNLVTAAPLGGKNLQAPWLQPSQSPLNPPLNLSVLEKGSEMPGFGRY